MRHVTTGEPDRRRALVTGGAGYIGSHLTELLLADGWEVYCLDDLSTGSLKNVAHLTGHPHFHLLARPSPCASSAWRG